MGGEEEEEEIGCNSRFYVLKSKLFLLIFSMNEFGLYNRMYINYDQILDLIDISEHAR